MWSSGWSSIALVPLRVGWILLCACVLLVGREGLAQRTINVPGDAATIQAGIDAANAGDTVLVAPGTYFENIDFKGKAITVTSSGGPTKTTIDGGDKAGVPTVLFFNGETSSSVISKFTIRGGGDAVFPGSNGSDINVDGGIYVGGASPTIEGNTIAANYCHNISVGAGAAIIRNNEVSGLMQGAGQQTSACLFGSAIFLGGTPDFATVGTAVIGNTIESNLTGSATYLYAAQNVLILNNTIRNNTSSDPGSAFISANSANTAVVQNLIYGNTSTCGGALGFETEGLDPSHPSILIANNTIVDNVTVEGFPGSECTPIAQIYPDPYSYGDSSPAAVIINNIISGSTTYPAVNCSQFDPPSLSDQPTFGYDILYNAGGAFFGSYCVDVSGEDNNVAADPQFVEPASGDYHLKRRSPAIDSGQNSVVQTFLAMTGQNLTTDFDGNPRIQDAIGNGCIIDMGIYEYPGSVGDCSSTTETLQSSSNPSTFGQIVAFTAQLSSPKGIPAGDVQFSDGSTTLGTVSVSNSGSAELSTSVLAVGSHIIKATYQPSGSLSAAEALLTQVVNGYSTTTMLASSLNPAPVGQSVTFTATVASSNGTPAGTVAFTDGTAALGTATLVNGTATDTTSSLAVGAHTIAATYTPAIGSSFSGSSAMLPQVVNGLPTITSLTVTPASAVFGTSVAMSSTVASSGGAISGGTIAFVDGAATLGSSAISAATPAASFVTQSLAVGVHTITAVYSGDATHDASTSAPVSVTIGAASTPDFSLASSPPALSVQASGHTTFTVTASSVGGFAGTLVFSNGSLPAYITLTPTPGQVQLSQGGAARCLTLWTRTVRLPTSPVSRSRGDGTGHSRLPRSAQSACF